jgi:DNA-binding transcriptional MerR regulator
MTGISIYTLRYYDKEHLFPYLHRNEKNIRIFSNADLEWICLIDCLRNADLSIAEIRHYVELNVKGDSTLKERHQIISKQETVLIQQLENIKNGLEHLRCKKNCIEERMHNLEEKYVSALS